MEKLFKNIFFILKNKAINGSRYVLVNYFSKYLNSFLVVEYPKSGGTWLGQLVSSYLEIPFPRNTFPVIGKSLIHGHFLPNERFVHFNKIFYLVRDGRDVIVSYYYYYFFFMAEKYPSHKDVIYIKKKLKFKDYGDIKSNLPKFIEFMFTNIPPKYVRFSYEGNWKDFNSKWLDFSEKFSSKVIFVKYENLLKNTKGELIQILTKIPVKKIDEKKVERIVDYFSFKKQTGRRQGEENLKSFLRKGIAGDWKNKFSKEAAEIFDFYAGDMLIRLNYEKDSKWVSNLKR